MAIHTISGIRVFYKILGQGVPLVMIHGSMSRHRLWDLQLILSQKSQLILLDLPGHGKSDPLQEEPTVMRFTEIVANLIQDLNLRRVIPIGHSLGGAIALQLALDYSSLLRGLILVGTGAKLGVLPALLKGLRIQYRDSVELAIGQMAFATNTDAALINRSKEECLRCNQDVAIADFVACNNFDVRTRLKEIKVPTLIIVGNEDKLTPIKWANFLAEHISHSDLKIINHAGHMVMLEQADQVNQAINDFLSSLVA